MARKTPPSRDPKKYAHMVEKDRPLFEWTLRDYKGKFISNVNKVRLKILAAWK